MMQSTVEPPTLAWTVTPARPSVVGRGNDACVNGSDPTLAPATEKIAPCAMPAPGNPLASRLPEFSTPLIVGCANAVPKAAKSRQHVYLRVFIGFPPIVCSVFYAT